MIPGAPLRQAGIVLIVSLLILLMLGVLTTAVMETSVLQLRMAGNDQAAGDALQRSLAVVDAILSRPGSLPVRGGVGYRVCGIGATDPACDETSISLSKGLSPAAGVQSFYASRVAPLQVRLPAQGEDAASSSIAYGAALYEIHAAYDGNGHGLGRAAVVQGVMVKVVRSAH